MLQFPQVATYEIQLVAQVRTGSHGSALRAANPACNSETRLYAGFQTPVFLPLKSASSESSLAAEIFYTI